MKAFDVLVELDELDGRQRDRAASAFRPAPFPAGAPASLSHAELVAARALVRQARELLRFSGSPWESPFYRDPVGFVEQLTAALDRALPMAAAYLEATGGDVRGVTSLVVYDRAEVERV